MCEGSQTQRSDAELVREMQAGGSRAFGALFERYRAPLFGYILGMLRDRALAEDVVQDAFLRLARQRDRIDPRRGVKAWLFRVARNRAIDIMRKRRPEIVSAEIAAGDGGAESQIDRTAPSEGLEREEIRRDVRQMLDNLPPREKDVLMLHYFGDLTFREVAAVVKRPLGTVLWQSRRALERLRRHMEQTGGEDHAV